LERIISRIGGLIISPKETMKILIHEKRGLAEALAIFLLFSVLNWVALVLALRHLFNYIIGAFIMSLRFLTLWLSTLFIAMGIIFDLIFWALLSVGIHLTAKAVDGGGSFEDTISVIGYSQVSRALCIIPLILSPFMPITSMILYIGLGVITIAWFIYLASIGLSEVHGISFEKALITVILPPLVILGLLIGIPLLWGLLSFWRWFP